MKRRAFKLVVFLLLGAILNVAVAWGCAFSAVRPGGEILHRRARPPLADTSLGHGIVLVTEQIEHRQLWSSSAGVDEESIIAVQTRYINGQLFHLVDDEWRSGFGSAVPHNLVKWIWISTAGWPVRSLQGIHASDMVTEQYISPEWGYWLAEKKPPVLHWADGDIFMPFRPLWPGFAINTIFYACVLWMMFGLPFLIRRRRRIKRGLCRACAYPIGSSPVCTECGENLPLPLGEGRGEGMNKHDGRSAMPSPLTPLPEGEGNDKA